MKNLTQIIIALTILASCQKEGCTDPSATNYNPEAIKDNGLCNYPCEWYETCSQQDTIIDGNVYTILPDSIISDLTLNSDINWLLKEPCYVIPGAILTINKGTTVYGAEDAQTFLSILPGAKIFAEGTPLQPIVFKPINPDAAPGDFGGIILNGLAPNNYAPVCDEGGTGYFGGSQPEDNSGILKYVRVEYGGMELSLDNFLSGFSFNCVGSGTTLENLQAYRCANDGFRFFGGTASLNNALSTGNLDDGFDWSFGWSGSGINWIVEQAPGGGDRGIEGENNFVNNTATPQSAPTITNITINGSGIASGRDAIKLREGTAGNINNVFINHVKNGIEIQHDATVANVTASTLIITNVTVSDVTNNFSISASVGTDSTNAAVMAGNAINGAGTGADSAWTEGWTKAL